MAEIRVLIKDGKMQAAVPGGVTDEQARRVLQRLIDEVGQDIPIVMEGEIEKHRHQGGQVQTISDRARR
jgi:hypothetical protein